MVTAVTVVTAVLVMKGQEGSQIDRLFISLACTSDAAQMLVERLHALQTSASAAVLTAAAGRAAEVKAVR